MSDNLRRLRAIKDQLRQLSPKASDRQRQHLYVLATLISSIVGSRHSNLSNIAAKGSEGPKRESQVKCFSRWLKNDHQG